MLEKTQVMTMGALELIDVMAADFRLKELGICKDRCDYKSWVGEAPQSVIENPMSTAGAARIAELAKEMADAIPLPRSIKRARAWSDDDGELCLDRAYLGEDRPLRGYRRRETNKPPALRIGIAMGGNSNRDLDWVGAAGAAAVDLAESAGYRIDVVGIHYAQGVYYGAVTDRMLFVPAKHAGEPLNLALFGTIFARQAFIRTAFFNSYATHKPRPDSVIHEGLGSNKTPPEDLMEKAGERVDFLFTQAYSRESAAMELRRFVAWLDQRMKG